MKKEEAASDYPMRRVSSHTIKEEWALRMQREKGPSFILNYPYSRILADNLEPASVEAATGVEVNEPDRIDYTFLKKYSVMVVEDTPELRSYLKETLSNYFARVYVAKDGKRGIGTDQRPIAGYYHQ